MRDPFFKCSHCGRFISYLDIETKKVKSTIEYGEWEPIGEYLTHVECLVKEGGPDAKED